MGESYSNVIFDLFGVLAPLSSRDVLSVHAAELSNLLGVKPDAIAKVFQDSWVYRQAGGCTTSDDIARLLRHRTGAVGADQESLRTLVIRLAAARITPTPRLIGLVEGLRDAGKSLFLCSDAGPDVAEAWAGSGWSCYFTQSYFSCYTGRIKPDIAVPQSVLEGAIYFGDGGGGELGAAHFLGARPVAVIPPHRGLDGDDERIARLVESRCHLRGVS